MPVTRTDLAAYLAKQPRSELERLYETFAKPRLTALHQAELNRRLGVETDNPALTWARTFAGRPIEFIAQIMPEWMGTDWDAWRAFVKTLFGIPLDERDCRTIKLCTGLEPEQVVRAHREAWLPIGRRGGKSRTLAMVALYLAVCFDWTPYLAPGQFGYISVLSDSRDHAGEIMNYIKGALGHPKLVALSSRDLAETVDLAGRVRIQVVTASIKAVRAHTVLAALCDEIAHWEADEESANPDVEILKGLRPAMATIPGSLLLCASSRYARKGALWEAYRDYYGKPAGPLVWSADTVTMHPAIDRAFLAEEEARDPLAFASEYGLEWRSDIAEFIQRERVESLVVKGRYELDYVPGTRYYAFFDAAGGSGEDSITLGIAHRDPRTGKGVLDLLRERRPPFDPESVVEEYAVDVRRYRAQSVTGDRYAGDWPAGQFRKRGVGYEPSEMTASDLYRESLPLLNGSKVELLDDKRFVGQVCALERKTSRLGKDTISHPPRQHDDLANVGLGALVLAAGSAGATVFSAEAVAKLTAMSAQYGRA